MTELVMPTGASSASLHSFLRSRRSIRRYRAETPDRRVLERIFETARQAPSAHNRQPWRYLVLSDPSAKAQLARAMGQKLAADRRADGDGDDAIDADITRSFARITSSPVVIVVALSLEEMDSYPDARRANAEYMMAVQSTAMAAQILSLAAHAEGLGSCWLCGPLFCPTEVRESLHMPEDWQPQGLLTLGYPSQPGKTRTRKPLIDFVRFDRD